MLFTFDGDTGELTGLLDSTIELLSGNSDPTPELLQKTVDDVDQLRSLVPLAPEDLSAQLQSFSDSMNPYLSKLEETGSSDFNTVVVRAAGQEIVSLCENAIAMQGVDQALGE